MYKDNSIEFKSNIYLRPYFEIQEISNPKKILKNELEHYFFNKSIYNKPNVIPNPGILEANFNASFMDSKIIEKSFSNNNISNENISNIQNNQSIKNNQTMEKNQTNQNKSQSNFNIDNTVSEKKIEVKHILEPSEYQFIDFGEKSYEKLCQYINKNNCIMWHGKLAPSVVENLFDNYSYIVKCIHDRKTNLREKFAELMVEEEKKLDESDHKAKKHLFNVFLKGYLPYEYIKSNYKNILSLLQGNNPNEEEEQENPQEDEQFTYEMNNLIDYFVNEDFEVINSILCGQNVRGNFLFNL